MALLQPKPLSHLATVPDEVPLLPSPSPNAAPLALQDLTDPASLPKEPFVLCIDGGGTKTSVIILDGNGNILGRGKSFGSNMTERGARQAAISIGRATTSAVDMARSRFPSVNLFESYILDVVKFESPPVPCPFIFVRAGLAGVDVQKDAEVMHLELSLLFGLKSEEEKKRLRVSNDTHLLASAIQPSHKYGVVLIAGTGSIGMAYGRQDDGEIEQLGRMGGYGYLLGDEGSAYWIGREAIKAALEIGDWHSGSYSKTDEFKTTSMASENSSPLTNLILEHYGVSSVDNLLSAIYLQPSSEGQATSEHNRKVKIAEVARLVVACAFPSPSLDSEPVGDALSLRVVQMAAEKLSLMVRDLCRAHRVDATQSTLVLGTGMWSSQGFRRWVVKLMEDTWVGTGGWGGVQMVDEPALAGARELLRRHQQITDQ